MTGYDAAMRGESHIFCDPDCQGGPAMDHGPDAPHQRCNRCGRLTWSPAQFDNTCEMTQPDGRACLGLFEWVGTGPSQAPADNARLSKLLFTAREAIEMLADIVSARSHHNPLHLRELVCEIDNYRADRGWSPHGFGGET